MPIDRPLIGSCVEHGVQIPWLIFYLLPIDRSILNLCSGIYHFISSLSHCLFIPCEEEENIQRKTDRLVILPQNGRILGEFAVLSADARLLAGRSRHPSHGKSRGDRRPQQLPVIALLPCNDIPRLIVPGLQRLVRFVARNGRIYYGDAILPAGETDIAKAKQARVIKGDIFGQHEVSDEVVDIRLLLSPLAPEHVRTVRCLGLNYARHAIEVSQ